MTEDEVLELLLRLEAFYDEPHDLGREQRWRMALAEANAGDINRAADTYMGKDPKWFPKPAQLIALAPTRMGSHQRTSEPVRHQRDPSEGRVVQEAPGCYWFLPPDMPIPF